MEERQTFLNSFVSQMSKISGLEPDEYQSRLESIMVDIQGVETLKLTITNLQNEGQLGDILNDNGTLNTELFDTYYQESAHSYRISVLKIIDKILHLKLWSEIMGPL